jgi:hypothetical protein
MKIGLAGRRKLSSLMTIQKVLDQFIHNSYQLMKITKNFSQISRLINKIKLKEEKN